MDRQLLWFLGLKYCDLEAMVMVVNINKSNGNGSGKGADELLVANEQAMKAMQNKFGAVNLMQGELKTFKEEVQKKFDELKLICDSSSKIVGELKAVNAGLKSNLDEMVSQMPPILNRISDNVDGDSNNLKTLVTRFDEVVAIVEDRLQVHKNWKYLSIGAIVVLLAIVVIAGYEINQLNNGFALLQSQVASQLAEDQKGMAEVKVLIEAKDKKGKRNH